MATLKAIRKRISSVKSTQQITKAMKMVAAAKLRRAQEAATEARPYAEKLGALLHSVAARVDATSHPLLAARPEEKRIELLVVTSDRGLRGAFNTNLIRRTATFLEENKTASVQLTMVGRKGFEYFRKRPVHIVEQHINLSAGPDQELATRLGRRFAQAFARDEIDAVYLLYSHFRSALTQVPTVERLLPIGTELAAGESPMEYLFEPDAPTLLDRLLFTYVNTLIHRAFLESVASEYGAAMTAMDSATNNAADMLDRLTLEMNRARQSAITKELMEIIGGAEALKG